MRSPLPNNQNSRIHSPCSSSDSSDMTPQKPVRVTKLFGRRRDSRWKEMVLNAINLKQNTLCWHVGFWGFGAKRMKTLYHQRSLVSGLTCSQCSPGMHSTGISGPAWPYKLALDPCEYRKSCLCDEARPCLKCYLEISKFSLARRNSLPTEM